MSAARRERLAFFPDHAPAVATAGRFCPNRRRSGERPSRNTTTQSQKQYPGFTVKITDPSDLGLAMLIAESEEGEYVPVAIVANVAEAREIASDDLASRMRRLENGETPFCPSSNKVWARGIDGEQRVACEFKDPIRRS